MIIDYKTMPAQVAHFYGPLIEFEQPLPLGLVGECLAGNAYFEKIPEGAGAAHIKFFRLSAAQDYHVRKELTFSTSIVYGMMSRHLPELSKRDGSLARKFVIFDSDIPAVPPEYLRRDEAEFEAFLNSISVTSDQIMKRFAGTEAQTQGAPTHIDLHLEKSWVTVDANGAILRQAPRGVVAGLTLEEKPVVEEEPKPAGPRLRLVTLDGKDCG